MRNPNHHIGIATNPAVPPRKTTPRVAVRPADTTAQQAIEAMVVAATFAAIAAIALRAIGL